MEVLYVEGLAPHDGPESCAGSREGVGEAWTGGVQAEGLSHEIDGSGCRHGHLRGRQHRWRRYARAVGEPRGVKELWHVRKPSCARTGRSHAHPPGLIVWVGRLGNTMVVSPR